jgi:hypothetical protein
MESQKYEQDKSSQEKYTKSNSWGRTEPRKKSGTGKALPKKFKQKPRWESQTE